jgi:hypothetical protein
MWFMSFTSGMWHNMRLGGATRGKCRIPDMKVRERSIFMFEAPKVIAPTCVCLYVLCLSILSSLRIP